MASERLVEALQEGLCGVNGGFAVDIEELFYLIPHDELFVAVRNCIETSGTVQFQNACGVSVDGFLELLSIYLTSTIVGFEVKFVVQRQGICIGSSVAPVLCKIFLAAFDRLLVQALADDKRVRVFRYVDDFLVLLIKS